MSVSRHTPRQRKSDARARTWKISWSDQKAMMKTTGWLSCADWRGRAATGHQSEGSRNKEMDVCGSASKSGNRLYEMQTMDSAEDWSFKASIKHCSHCSVGFVVPRLWTAVWRQLGGGWALLSGGELSVSGRRFRPPAPERAVSNSAAPPCWLQSQQNCSSGSPHVCRPSPTRSLSGFVSAALMMPLLSVILLNYRMF